MLNKYIKINPNLKGKFQFGLVTGAMNGKINDEKYEQLPYLFSKREWTEENWPKIFQEYASELQKMKANARSYLHVYIKRGKIIKTNCVICDSADVEAHHNDYAKPLDVIWFCRKCHLDHHEKEQII